MVTVISANTRVLLVISMDAKRLCPECYEEMKPVYNEKGIVIYHKCPKCGMKILFTHSGH
jgi:predicted RNA-binding Zn-ribbon protein involved in translation (DUF1610 family)